MAKLERSLQGSFDEILNKIETGILNGSLSATLEEASDFKTNDLRCSVRAFERYSYTGKNRVSLTVTLFGCDDNIKLSAIATGGSQAVFFKINTWDEDAFLEKLEEIL